MADRLVSVDSEYIFPKPLEDRLDNKVKVSSDAARLAAIEASMGPKVVAIDTDGTPYHSPAGGTHRIFLDADNVPYFTLNPWPVAGADASGTPIITF